VIYKEINEFSPQIYSEITSLLSQLTSEAINFSSENFKTILKNDNTFLLGAFDENKLVGILTLIIYQIPTGKNGRIEDVVVDESYRGKGIGEQLSLMAINKGKELNLDKLFLTSNPSRIAANSLYQKIGFLLGKTNSYFYNYKK
jgi:ribosomal protein S18 acetylase RimI-like enzyme